MKIAGLMRPFAAGLIVVLSGTGCHFASDAFEAKFTKNEAKSTKNVELAAPAAGITAIDVSVNIGRIQLDAADVAEVQIAAEIRVKARTEEKAQELGEQVHIEATASGQTLRVRAIKPAGLKDENLSINCAITAPAALRIECSTNVGDIRTAGFTGAVEAHTNVGAIVGTDLRGDADLHTNVGDIRAEYAPDAPAAVEIDASADVGKIELVGPKEISAKLTATANVGDIHTDRPVMVSGHLKQSIRGALGDGEGRISLRTNVGSIRIR